MQLISRDKQICHGQPVFTGTRVLISVIISCIHCGLSDEEIHGMYPTASCNNIAELRKMIWDDL